MALTSNHPEDIKAAIRKRFGSMLRFETARELPKDSVRDVLRGRAVQRTAAAIAYELDCSVEELFPGRFKSHLRDDSATDADAHRLNVESR